MVVCAFDCHSQISYLQFDRSFKYFRTIAIYYIFNEFRTDPPPSRVFIPSLMLGAACIYMLNAIMSRPRDWRAERALRDACCLRVPYDVDIADEDSLDQEFDVNDIRPMPEAQGMYVVADIRRDARRDWLRLPQDRVIELPQLCILYKAATLSDIRTAMGAGGITVGRRRANPARLNNRISQTSNVEWVNPDAITDCVFGLNDRGIRLHPSIRLAGPDQGASSDDEPDDFERNVTRDIGGLLYPDSIIDRIWAQFPYDLIQVSPNLKSRRDPAYTTLNAEQQMKVTLELFKRPVLPFRTAWVRFRDQKFWSTTQFDRFFPPKGARLENLQNFTGCRYFRDWMIVMTQATPQHAKAIRAKVHKKFMQILWLPHTESDRMWSTKIPLKSHDYHKWTMLSLTDPAEDGPGPRIALNHSLTQDVEVTLGVVMPEEEEEEGDTPPPFDDLQMPPLPEENPFLLRQRWSVAPEGIPQSRGGSVVPGDPRAASVAPPNQYSPPRRQPSILSYLGNLSPQPLLRYVLRINTAYMCSSIHSDLQILDNYSFNTEALKWPHCKSARGRPISNTRE